MSIVQTCSIEGGEVLECRSPALPDFQDDVGAVSKRSKGSVLLNYTLELDGAPGPNISVEGLALFLRPNPVFSDIDEADSVYVLGKSISISVWLCAYWLHFGNLV